MATRRNTMRTIGTVGLSLIAGCTTSSSSSTSTPTSTSSSTDSSSNNPSESTTETSDGQITEIRPQDGKVTVSIKDGSEVNHVNLLKDGDLVQKSTVSTGETQTSFAFLSADDMTGWFTAKPPGTYQFIAVDSDDKQVGSADYQYQPNIELADVSTGTTDFPDGDESSQWLVLSITNTGNALAAFAGMEFEYRPEKDVNKVEAADEEVPTFVRDPGLDEGKLGTTSLNTKEEFGNMNRDAHLIQPGETKKFITRGFFKSYRETFDEDALTPADFKRTFNLSIFTTPKKETRTTYEVTAHLTGKLKSKKVTGEYMIWCGTTEVTNFQAL